MPRDPIPPGTLHLLILQTLSRAEEMHGFEVAEAIERLSGDVLTVEEGSLYPALYRMEKKRWIEAEWGMSELGRRAKFYRLTPLGRKRLAAQTAEWSRFAAAVSRVLLTP